LPHLQAGKDIALLKNRTTNLPGIAFVLCLFALGLIDRSATIWAEHLPRCVVQGGLIVTFFGTSGYMFVLSIAIVVGAFSLRGKVRNGARRERLTLLAHRAVFFFLALAVSGLGVQMLKHVIGRARPRLLEQMGTLSFHPFTPSNAYASFPSGHTTSAFAAAMALSLMAPRYGWPLFLGAAAIGLSRVVVHQHYPSDVLAGAAFGSLVAFLMARSAVRRGLALFPAMPAWPEMSRDR
jgi:membrane-associated phospholipid phosphatase